MIVTLQTERVRTPEQVRAFVEGSEAVDPRFHGAGFTGADRESVYEFVRRALVRLDYERLGKSDKGLVRRYMAKVMGLSRAQLTRLIGRYRETGRIEDRRGGAPACPFERRYTRADIPAAVGDVGVAPFQWTVKGLGFMQLPGSSSRRPWGIADRGPGDDDGGYTIHR